MLKNTIAYINHKPSISIGFLFSVGSLLLGIWVAALPAIKERLQFTDGTLGASLLLAPAGSLLGAFLSSKIFSRIPAGKFLLAAAILQCLMYMALVYSVNRQMFWIALFASGFLGCLKGIASNAIVDSTEKKYGRKIMSTSHAMYSIGGGLSAGLAALFNGFGIISTVQIVVVAGTIITVLLLIRKQVLSHTNFIHSGASFARPPVSILGLAFICFATFMGEGCITDWSSIYLKESLHTSIAVASLGYAGFSAAMALGRLNGDALVLKVNPGKLVMAGSLAAAAGFSLIIFLPYLPAAIMGFTLVGLGYSCIVPILFSAAANVPGLSPALGIASMATGGLLGFLLGPAVIGYISEKFSLASGLAFVLVLSLSAFWVASRNKYLKALPLANQAKT